MEADQARQSASTPANNSDSHPQTPQHPYPPQPYRESSERPYHDLPAMATATVLQPGSSYPPPPQSSYPSAYGSGSAPEPRRNPEETETASRQSLPSISEVISKTANQYPAPTQPTAQTNSSFPLPFSGPPRLHGEAEKHASPQGPPTIGQFSQFSVRRDSQPTFAESPRPSSSARPVLPGLPERRPSPPSIRAEYNHAHAHEAHRDHRAVNGAYPHPTAPAPAPSNSYPSGHLPQGQMPLPPYPSSPRHGPPQAYSGYDRLGPPGQMEEAARDARAQYEAQNAYPAPWSYGEALGRLAQSARTTYGFAEAYGRIAQEQHGAAPIPERLPSDQEVTDVIANFELQRAALERVREVIAQTIRNERARDLPKQPKISYQDDHDVPMFEDAKGPYEVKKRRGRAAPPGRCHSCNRVDTPEWRRGPDGARTLCNACGLHYAKLERKRQLEQRNIRPKPNEDRV